jgi:hypothetical protein
MSRLRGVDPFDQLWARRTTLTDEDGTSYELLSLPDLVQAKKTQRSKDWPMVQRLLEAHYLGHRQDSTEVQRRFWLRELRTPALLVDVVQRWPDLAKDLVLQRPLLELAHHASLNEVEEVLIAEERAERERDRQYWLPLKAELEQIRQAVRKQKRHSNG